MDNFTFGVTMMVTGMGGTLLALTLLAVLMHVLKMLFPFKRENDK
jgi:Na+-transporting methylmalonyl-CoA/oxaloacetate decarboxylase gamma subunit